eukprot:Rmarinus@m.25763
MPVRALPWPRSTPTKVSTRLRTVPRSTGAKLPQQAPSTAQKPTRPHSQLLPKRSMQQRMRRQLVRRQRRLAWRPLSLRCGMDYQRQHRRLRRLVGRQCRMLRRSQRMRATTCRAQRLRPPLKCPV